MTQTSVLFLKLHLDLLSQGKLENLLILTPLRLNTRNRRGGHLGMGKLNPHLYRTRMKGDTVNKDSSKGWMMVISSQLVLTVNNLEGSHFKYNSHLPDLNPMQEWKSNLTPLKLWIHLRLPRLIWLTVEGNYKAVVYAYLVNSKLVLLSNRPWQNSTSMLHSVNKDMLQSQVRSLISLRTLKKSGTKWTPQVTVTLKCLLPLWVLSWIARDKATTKVLCWIDSPKAM